MRGEFGSVKYAQGLGRLDDASLRTLFYEAMAIINSRPLTVDGLNDPNFLEPLTLNHLIQIKSKVLNITIRQKWHVPRRNLRVNDVVIVKEDLLPRSQWQLGRIVETTLDSDGLVRRAKLRVGEKDSGKLHARSKPTIVERPVQKLVLLLEIEH